MNAHHDDFQHDDSQDENSQQENSQDEESPREEKNWLEWTVFAIGLLLVTALLGYLVYDAVAAQSGPPRLTVRLGKPQQHAGHYAVPVAVENSGYETAEQVHVEIELTHSDGTTEQADFAISFLPRGATRHGTVTFETDPRTAQQITPRVLGYQRP